MLERILILELGNKKGLKSPRNLFKILYTFIVPNIVVILMATVLGSQKFYEPKQMLLLVLGWNIFITIVLQYIAQRNIFASLEKEVLLKFTPTKTEMYIKMRLSFLMMKFYFPVLLFTVILISYLIQANTFILFITMILLMIFMINLQVYLAIMIRYYVNMLKPLYLQIGQISFFLIFVTFTGILYMFSGIYFLETMENMLNDTLYTSFNIHPLNFFRFMVAIVVLSIIFMFIVRKLNFNLLIWNRNISLHIHTNALERIHKKIYGVGLSDLQRLMFAKEIKHIFRNSKVFISLIGLMHLISLGFLVFFFIGISEIKDMGVFISKLYLGFILGQIILTGILSSGLKDILNLENDVHVVKNYHIDLPIAKMIKVKTKILRAFVFPKLTLMYAILIITVMIMNEYQLAFIFLLNYFICFLLRNTLERWRVKETNRMNSDHQLLSFINLGLILLFSYSLLHLFNSFDEHVVTYQLFSLGAMLVLYWFHLLVFKNDRDKEEVRFRVEN